MARRKNNPKARALQPAVMKMNFRITPADSTRQYIDISECVSKLNRRFYRQGLNWAVANVKISTLPAYEDPATPGIITPVTGYVNSIPHTWCVANGWLKAMKHWKAQQDDAMEQSGSQSAIARYRDFKIFADTDHVDKGFNNNLKPFTLGPGTVVGPVSPGLVTGAGVLDGEEWLNSQIVIPNLVADASGSDVDPFEYALHMVGTNQHLNLSRGIIDGYQQSRSFPQSPDPAAPQISNSTNWMRTMRDVGNDTSEITANAENRNDELPYDQLEYPGSDVNMDQLETQGYFLNRSTTGVSTFNTGPFTAPCGLIRIDLFGQTDVSTWGNYTIVTVELVPGDHRGYLCQTMEEF